MSDNTNKNKSPKKQPPLKDIFNKFAKKALSDFPKLKNRFMLYSLPTDSWHGSIILNDKTSYILEELYQDAENNNEPVPFARKEEGYFLIAYIKDFKKRTMTSKYETHEKEVYARLEHELGHLIAPGGASLDRSDNFGECVADSFAFIRLQQRFGNIQNALKATNWIATKDLILNGEELHFTSPALQRLERLSQKHDLSKLTPTETVNLAYRITLQSAPSQKQLSELSKIFEPVRKRSENNIQSVLNACAEIMTTDHGALSALVFETGLTFIKPFLEKSPAPVRDIALKREIKALKFEDKAWKELFKKIKKLEDREKTPACAFKKKIKDMQVLGYFDSKKDKKINPAVYEAKENKIRIKRERRAYIRKTFGL